MESRIDKKLNMDSDWREWSNYVLITLEKLSDAIAKRDKESIVFKDKMVVDLVQLKDTLIDKISISDKICKGQIEEVITKVEEMIKEVCDDTSDLDKKIDGFNEDVLIPLRIKITVISIIGGSIGGTIICFLGSLLFKHFGG
jgi:hypothetical protein